MAQCGHFLLYIIFPLESKITMLLWIMKSKSQSWYTVMCDYYYYIILIMQQYHMGGDIYNLYTIYLYPYMLMNFDCVQNFVIPLHCAASHDPLLPRTGQLCCHDNREQ